MALKWYFPRSQHLPPQLKQAPDAPFFSGMEAISAFSR
jgi:hypothetical protein